MTTPVDEPDDDGCRLCEPNKFSMSHLKSANRNVPMWMLAELNEQASLIFTIRHSMSKMARAGFRIALLQLKVGPSKADNLANALTRIRSAVRDNGARVVALPECFNSPYGTQHFAKYAEEIPSGETSRSLSAVAKELGIYLIGGTIPERTPTATYNTCTVWSPEGALLATYRKIHLFDINIPGGITFRESDVVAEAADGEETIVADVDFGKVDEVRAQIPVFSQRRTDLYDTKEQKS
ncbi:conserved hypothetical protein [Culex quinquefasciatus]|uniref:omega-amidase n=1 Tax=Culex quinquefasciatus TaxID=7176 RepID=B0X5I0_CULQU|nr:conserved hypothetical protein [Culex quinquefasciatus]|eukprot:XP_001864902.1 conserved hypothetical protein [Culex quinquefasciatus]